MYFHLKTIVEYFCPKGVFFDFIQICCCLQIWDKHSFNFAFWMITWTLCHQGPTNGQKSHIIQNKGKQTTLMRSYKWGWMNKNEANENGIHPYERVSRSPFPTTISMIVLHNKHGVLWRAMTLQGRIINKMFVPHRVIVLHVKTNSLTSKHHEKRKLNITQHCLNEQ